MGQVLVPSSKSQSIRGLILGLLAQGESVLQNPLNADDVQDSIRVCRHFGAAISLVENTLSIRSSGLPLRLDTQNLNTGNSGICTRFILPLLGLRADAEQVIHLDCGEQMRARPIHHLVEALRGLGLSIDYLHEQGRLPLGVSGRLQGGQVELQGLSSQYLSALLIALPCAAGDSELRVHHLAARPYVEMTLAWLRAQKLEISHQRINGDDVFKIKGNQGYQNFDAAIAGDFSSASNLIAAAVMIPGRVELQGLNLSDPQGDKRLVEILTAMGASIQISSRGLEIEGNQALKGIRIDANEVPDLLPTLAVIGTYAQGQTEIVNVAEARFKETDRIHSMTEGLSRMGARIDAFSDGMRVYQSQLQGSRVKGYQDHRTVMALALAGLRAEGLTEIDDGMAISKTFPTFVTLMRGLGARMGLSPEGRE